MKEILGKYNAAIHARDAAMLSAIMTADIVWNVFV